MRAAATVAALWAVRAGGLPAAAASARLAALARPAAATAARAMRTVAGSGSGDAPGCATRSAAAVARMRRTAETMLSAVRARAARSPCRPGEVAGGRHGRQHGGAGGQSSSSAPRRAGLAAGGAVLLALPLESLRRSFSHRRVSIQEAAADCDRLLASVVRTRYRTYWRQRLFTIECDPPYPDAPVLVVTHGYAAGAGMFAFDLDALASRYHVYCVDWLGCGASERPPWTPTTVADGERWFTDSLADWAAAGGLDAPGFVLLGHSLGGYLSAAYALRNPGHVRHLVLASPAGIPSPPDPAALAARQGGWLMGLLRRAWERGVTPQALVRALGPWGEVWAGNLLTARFRHVLEREGVDVDAALAKPAKPGNAAASEAAAAEAAQAEADALSGATEAAETAAALERFAQQSGAGSGSRSSNGGAASAGDSGAAKRFDLEAFRRYLYDITVADASGELALPVLLSFGAHARVPMGPRLIAAAATGEASANSDGTASRLTIPVTLLYGSHDWMDARAGAATADALRRAGLDAACLITPQAGHHLYMEQPAIFCNQVLGRLAEADGRASRGGGGSGWRRAGASAW